VSVAGAGPPAPGDVHSGARPFGCDHGRLSDESITVRIATHNDLDAVLKLWESARSEHAVSADRPEAVGRLLETDAESLLVAESDGSVVGVMIAAWDGWRGNMYRLAIDPRHRRRGIGRRLVDAGEKSLRARGARRVTALVAFDDDRAGGFWDAVGYPPDQEIGRRVRNI
jgi:ribosomal protein S18 acetylase RimI-like enzyme